MHLSLDVLKSQREEAERAYNEWLTRLDALHHLPVPYVKNPVLLQTLQRLNDLARSPLPELERVTAVESRAIPSQISLPAVIDPGPVPRSLTGRIKGKIRRALIRFLQLDSRLQAVAGRTDWAYETIRNRLGEIQSELGRLVGLFSKHDSELAAAVVREQDFRVSLIAFLNDYAQGYHDLSIHLQEVESARIRYLQTVMALVDTKDRELNGLINNHVQNIFNNYVQNISNHLQASDNKLKDLIQNRIELLSGRLDVLLEAFDRKQERMMLQLHESALVRDGMHRELQKEFRSEIQSEISRRQESISETVNWAKQEISDLSTATLSLKRHVQNLIQAAPAKAGAAAGAPAADREGTADAAVDDYKYSNFEFRYRGSEALIRDRFTSYADLFGRLQPVLDAGCGRGEFLELLSDRSISCYGIDINDEMVAHCRDKGLRAEKSGIVEHLVTLEDGSLGGIFNAQVVEHLEPQYLLRFLDLAFFKLKKDGLLVIETINPTSLYAIFEAYYRDLTHVQPLHPDTLKFFAESSGFVDVAIQYRSPVAEELKLTGHDANTAKLNRILFGEQDYALIAKKM